MLATKTAGKRTGDAPRVRAGVSSITTRSLQRRPKNAFDARAGPSPALQDVRNVPEARRSGRHAGDVCAQGVKLHVQDVLAHVPGFQLKDDDRYWRDVADREGATATEDGNRRMFCPPCFALAIERKFTNEGDSHASSV